MLSKLRNNPVFLAVTPIVSLIGLGIMEYFMYPAFTLWCAWQVALLASLSAVCIVAFSFFASFFFIKEDSKKKITLFTVLSSLIMILFYFGGSAIILVCSRQHLPAYIFGVVSFDVLLLFEVFYVLFALCQKYGKKVFIVTTSCFLAVLIGIGGFISYIFMPKNSDINAVQNFTMQDTLATEAGPKKAKVILLNGQSNASGCSRVPYLRQNVSEEEFSRYSSGYENVYINYYNDNGNNTSYGAFVHVGLDQGCAKGFYGPEVGIADYLSQAYPDETIFIIKYAWGGSVLGTQWFAPRADGSVGPLYTAFINFTKGCMDYLRSKNYDVTIDAMCWMQGESDSGYDLSVVYYDNTSAFVSSLRKDLASYANPNDIYFIDAGITDSPYWINYGTVNLAKQKYASDNPTKGTYISTLDLSYGNEPIPAEGGPDLAHYDSLAQITLGNRFGEAIKNHYDDIKEE